MRVNGAAQGRDCAVQPPRHSRSSPVIPAHAGTQKGREAPASPLPRWKRTRAPGPDPGVRVTAPFAKRKGARASAAMRAGDARRGGKTSIQHQPKPQTTTRTRHPDESRRFSRRNAHPKGTRGAGIPSPSMEEDPHPRT